MNDASSNGSDQSRFRPDATSSNDEQESSAPAATDHARNLLEKKKHVQRDQKTAMLDHLIRNLDILIYAQFSVLYYMDCSLFYFLLRALPHWFYFTPKPSLFPPPPLTHRPYISVIFGSNILCMLLHLIFGAPAVGEATRFYLHGGVLIDFVGQKSPVRRWTLMILDLLVLALQLLVLGVILERKTVVTNNGGSSNNDGVTPGQGQDHDSEERGLLRQDTSTSEGYEMQELRSSSQSSILHSEREQDDLMRESGSTETRDQHPLDSYYSGQKLIANLRVVDTVRAQWNIRGPDVENTDASASGMQAAVVAAAAGRTLTYRLGEGIQSTV